MSLVSLRDVSFGFGGPYLLEGLNLQIEAGERIGLLGRNGAGKSTLMKLINDDLSPDEGQLTRGQGVRVSRLIQEVPVGEQGTIWDVVAAGLGSAGDLLGEYHRLSDRFAEEGSRELEQQLHDVQQSLDASGSWQLHQNVERILSQMQLDADADFSVLSSGMKRRVLLAKTLVLGPELLLLDEPTNHLDIDAIEWMEDFLLRLGGSLVFVTHDRMFLQRLATRIVEVDRGRLFDWTCNYQTFLSRKEAALEAEAQQQALFDKKLAEEEVWIRQGIRARRTRNEGRVRALKKLREERRDRKQHVGNVRMQAQSSERSGSMVVETKDIGFSYDGSPVVQGFSTKIMRGDKIGIIGPNGAGKTTLIKLLLGQLEPQQGTLRHGTKLETSYFDQTRETLDEEKTVQENVGDGQEMLLVNGNQRHIIGYLQDFLFSPERARRPARFLSGGERNRLLLARLFTKPSNLLVMDEPTNDLDAETLDLLEELLMEYQGTLLLVSHDRAFLNNVVTSTLVFEGDGQIKEYDGGYDDWVRQKSAQAASSNEERARDAKKKTRNESADKPRKLTFNEQRELEKLPARIEELETEQAALHEKMAAPTFYQQGGSEIAEATQRLEQLEAELSHVFERWELLEGLRD